MSKCSSHFLFGHSLINCVSIAWKESEKQVKLVDAFIHLLTRNSDIISIHSMGYIMSCTIAKIIPRRLGDTHNRFLAVSGFCTLEPSIKSFGSLQNDRYALNPDMSVNHRSLIWTGLMVQI